MKKIFVRVNWVNYFGVCGLIFSLFNVIVRSNSVGIVNINIF